MASRVRDARKQAPSDLANCYSDLKRSISSLQLSWRVGKGVDSPTEIRRTHTVPAARAKTGGKRISPQHRGTPPITDDFDVGID